MKTNILYFNFKKIAKVFNENNLGIFLESKELFLRKSYELYELIKNIKKYVIKLYKNSNKEKKNTNSNFNGNKKFHFKIKMLIFTTLILLIKIVWLMSGIFIVQEGQVAVVTKFGKYLKTTPAGIHWRFPYPIQEHEVVNVSQVRTFEVGFRGNSNNKMLSESLMLTTEENIIDMQFVVQYRLKSNEEGARDYLFSMRNPDDSVKQASETAMRDIVGKKTMDVVLYEGRTKIALSVQKLMQQILDRYNTGIQIESVAIQNVQPPEQVQAAFDDAIKAGQDRERQISEGEAYANQVIPLASGKAFRINEQANGYKAKVIGDANGNASRFVAILKENSRFPKIMQDRLYLEAIQSVFCNSTKIMIDTTKNNNIIYLPLDKFSGSLKENNINHSNLKNIKSNHSSLDSSLKSNKSLKNINFLKK